MKLRVFAAVPVSVYVHVVNVLPFRVVATRAPIVCVPVNVFAASVLATVKFASGNVIVLAAVGQENVSN